MKISAGSSLPHRALPSQRIVTGDQQPVATNSLGQKELPEYDMIVIGGGINGTAIARDASTRGLKVLLIEKNDFGSATSAWNSRLIHGGFRYLEHKEVGLVMESLQERERLLNNAPHLVRPMPSLMPIFSHNDHGLPLLTAGQIAYDLLSSPLLQGRLKRNMPRHDTLGKKGVQEMLPGIDPKGLKGGVFYFDAQVPLPERLSVENAIAAQESGNATILNHAEVTGITVNKVAKENLEASGVEFKDMETGEQYAAKAKVVVNAAGPWVDDIIQKIPQIKKQGVNGVEDPQHRIGGVEGTHIVVDKFPGAPEVAMYFQTEGFQNEADRAKNIRRYVFIIPWINNTLLIGTTERKVELGSDMDKETTDQEAIDYLINETNRVLPGAQLDQNKIKFSYSGVRPLPYEPGVPANKVTRNHVIENHGKGEKDFKLNRFVSIVGGKLTTMRNLGEEAVDQIVKDYKLRLPDGSKVGESQTREQPMPGGEGILDKGLLKQAKKLDPAGFKAADKRKLDNMHQWSFKKVKGPDAAQQYGVSLQTVERLMDLYGARFNNVLDLTKENPDLAKPLYEGSQDIGAQVVYALRNELAGSVSDVVMRRICAGLGPDSGLPAARPVAEIMGRELGWSGERVTAEVEAFKGWKNEFQLAFSKP